MHMLFKEVAYMPLASLPLAQPMPYTPQVNVLHATMFNAR